jgi:F-type H+-transporting ATPase subunit epsilon
VTLKVELVVPDRELWAGEAQTVIAKTTEGDIGVLTGHSPVFGILAEGSLVEILNPDAAEARAPVRAAVAGGFLSVADNQVSILAAEAQLGDSVDVAAARQDLESALAEGSGADEEPVQAKYARARLRAAGEQA